LTRLIELDVRNPGLVRQYASPINSWSSGRPGSFGRCSRRFVSVASANAVVSVGGLGGVMTSQSDLIMDMDEFAMDAAHVSDMLVSLTHLGCWNGGDFCLIQLYARVLAERLLGLGALLRSADPNIRETRARLCN
jgi:hypothetical protein